MNEIIAVCPGSYDPITKGHEDIIDRASKMFSKVYVVVAVNKNKKTLFSKEERVLMCKKVFEGRDNIEVVAFDGLTISFCETKGRCVLVKGVRNASDYEYEKNIAVNNAVLSGQKTETIFIPAKPELGFISSSAVRELLSYGADITGYVSEKIKEDIRKKCCREV